MTNPNRRRHSAASAVVSPGSIPGQPLDVVSENVEIMHGYYGPRHNQVGQTAAGLEVGVDVTSPLAVRFSNTR
jgi:3-oxoacyl-(acyl-carrier-protein) synthase